MKLEATAWLLDSKGAGANECTNRLEIFVRLP